MIQKIKSILENGLYRLGIVALIHWWQRQFGAKIVILMYHRIAEQEDDYSQLSVRPLTFEKQMNYLKKHAQVITMDQACCYLANQCIPKGIHVVISFDDGYQDNYTHAFPILKARSLPAIIYLTTGYIGKQQLLWWDRLHVIMLTAWREKIRIKLSSRKIPAIITQQLGRIQNLNELEFKQLTKSLELWLKKITEDQKNKLLDQMQNQLHNQLSDAHHQMLSWSQVKEMHDQGITIGAHTVTHPILTKINLLAAKQEIKKSKKQIQEQLGCAIVHFAYPNGCHGDYNHDIINLLRKAEFKTACSTIGGFNYKDDDVMSLKRQAVTNGSIANFARKLI